MNVSIIAQGLDSSHIQDDLFELLQDPSVKGCNALVAFVTLDGIVRLGPTESGILDAFLKQRHAYFHLVVCTDLVTTADALEELLRLQTSTGGKLTVKSFDGQSLGSRGKFFHPKVYIFERFDGTGTVIVGSNNMTPGGLSDNVEAAVRLDGLTAEELQSWTAIWDSADHQTREVDSGLVESVRRRRRLDRERRPRIPRTIPTEPEEESPRILVRFIPRAGGRTSQVHFTRDIAEQYFHLRVGGSARLKLQQIQPGQPPGQIEVRTLVYSRANRNPKIEVTGVKSIGDYGEGNPRPIIVFEEVDKKFFRYMVLESGSPGYDELSALLLNEQQRGAALQYKITNLEALLGIWPDYPN